MAIKLNLHCRQESFSAGGKWRRVIQPDIAKVNAELSLARCKSSSTSETKVVPREAATIKSYRYRSIDGNIRVLEKKPFTLTVTVERK